MNFFKVKFCYCESKIKFMVNSLYFTTFQVVWVFGRSRDSARRHKDNTVWELIFIRVWLKLEFHVDIKVCFNFNHNARDNWELDLSVWHYGMKNWMGTCPFSFKFQQNVGGQVPNVPAQFQRVWLMNQKNCFYIICLS